MLYQMPYPHDVHFQGGPCSCSYSFGEKSHECKSKKTNNISYHKHKKYHKDRYVLMTQSFLSKHFAVVIGLTLSYK